MIIYIYITYHLLREPETAIEKGLKQDSSHSDSSSFKLHSYRVGGFNMFNPFEKYLLIKFGIISPSRGENKKLFETTTLVFILSPTNKKKH